MRLKDIEIYKGDISLKTTTKFTKEFINLFNKYEREDITTFKLKHLSRKRQ